MKYVVAVCALFAVVAAADAAVITVGDWDVPVGEAAVPVTISISTATGETVEDATLLVQVGDGGPDLGGLEDGPNIVGVDFTNSIWVATDFAASASPGLGVGDNDQIVQFDVLLGLDTGVPVDADGVVAVITLDASAFGTSDVGKQFDLLITSTLGGDSDFPGLVGPTIINGTVTLVPEPASLLLLGAGGMLLAARPRKRA